MDVLGNKQRIVSHSNIIQYLRCNSLEDSPFGSNSLEIMLYIIYKPPLREYLYNSTSNLSPSSEERI